MLVILEGIKKGYSDKKLLEGVSLNIENNDKIGLVGRNGFGKSTFLKILAKVIEPDSGDVNYIGKTKVSYLSQDLTIDTNNSVLSEVLKNTKGDSESIHIAKSILTKLELTDYDKIINDLSGGEKRKVALASCLVKECDLLILDEPTNHLDSDMIEWLEKYLIKFDGALIMVTHDRYFLERVVKKIIELENGNIIEYDANYSKYLVLKEERLEAKMNEERKIETFLRKETEWIQRGARARSTKEKKRIEKYDELVNREKYKENNFELSSAYSRLGKNTIELINVSKSYEKPLFKDFSIDVERDARIGIIGKNGSGKTTLLKIMAGEVEPDSGIVKIGETVKIGYFFQTSEELPDMKVIDYIKEVSDIVKTKTGYITASQMLEKFLFDEPYIPVSKLSGGEKRRLALIRILMTNPNILILDEPTNDLDIQTLMVLEDYLESFIGAVIVVSHDRYFLDKVVNVIYSLESDNHFHIYNGGYSDYLSKRKIDVKTVESKDTRVKEKRIKLSYLEQKEYEKIEEDTEIIASQIEEVQKKIDENITNYLVTKDLYIEKERLEKLLEEKFERWEYLSEIDRKSKEK